LTSDPRASQIDAEELARLLHEVAEDKKAWEPVTIDLRGKTTVADFFVVCEGETDRQVRAIADAMQERLRELKVRPIAVDGYDDASWILLDFDAVIAHVFLPGERSYYDLETLWNAAAKSRTRAL
jgi:ribosome-associated protein